MGTVAHARSTQGREGGGVHTGRGSDDPPQTHAPPPVRGARAPSQGDLERAGLRFCKCRQGWAPSAPTEEIDAGWLGWRRS